jgi:hypothetical protein
MRQLLFLTSGFIVVMAVSCGSNDKEAKTDTPAVNTPVNTSVAPVASPVVSTTPSVSTTTPTITPVTTTTSQPVTTTTAGLNPAHGQPGHRCDISVGAPLNSPPGKVTTPTVNSNSAPANLSPSIVNTSPQIVPTPSTQTVAAGMNPAHGQPGHRCDIAVGSPLNSPVKPIVTPTVVKQ